MAAENLTKMIDALVEQKTFGLDAINGVKALRDKAAEQETSLAALKKQYDDRTQEETVLQRALADRDGQITKWKEREAALILREGKVTDLEKAAAVNEAIAKTIDSCFTRAFANRIVRESTQSSVPQTFMSPGSSYPSTNWVSKSENVAREEG